MKKQKKLTLSPGQIEQAARLFATLSEPSRLLLLKTLMERPLTVGELVDRTGLKQGNVSKQLGILLESRLVVRRKEGNFARYSIADSMLYDLCGLVCCKLEQDARDRLKDLGW